MSFRAKLLVVSVLVTVLPLTVVSWLGIDYLRRDKEAFVALLGTEVTPVVAGHLSANTRRIADQLDALAQTSTSQALRKRERTQAAADAFARSELLAVKVVVAGSEILSLRKDDVLPSGSDARTILDALTTPDEPVGKGAVFVRNATRLANYPLALIAIERQSAGGTATAVGLVPVDSLLRLSLASTFDTWVVSADGEVLIHSDRQWITARRDVSEMLPVRDLQNGLTGSKEYESLAGEAVLGSYAPASVGGLGVVQELPVEAVYGAVQAAVVQVIFAVVVVLIVSLLAAVLLARGVSRPLTELAASARAIGQGRLDGPIPDLTGGEMGELAGAFKSMQSSLADRDARLQEAQDALMQSEKMSALGQLAAGITHEVKNPIAGITGFAQLCLKIAPEGSPLTTHLKLIERESKRAKEILDNLLRFSRMEKVEMLPLEPNTVVAESLKLVAHQLQIQKVQVSTHYAEGLPHFMGNLSQLQQVIMNLTMNASQAMQPKGGRLQVSTSSDKDGRVIIEVKDEGRGIKPEDRSRLFTPFFSTKKKGEGTGLGLSVSYGIIKQHQGEIRVWSQVGVGTIFYLYLPSVDQFRPEDQA